MIYSGTKDVQIILSKNNCKNDTLVIIPILNEGDRILLQLTKMKEIETPFDVIIVDGGSKDESLSKILNEKFEMIQAIVVDQSKVGLSRQLQIGMTFGIQNNYKNIVTMDGNNKDHPIGILEIIKKLDSGHDFVQGSRFIGEGKAINNPLSRTLAIRLIHAPVTSIFSKFRYTDTTNGFRGFSRSIIIDPKMNMLGSHFKSYELIAYIPVRAAKLRYKICEAGVIREYPLGSEIPTKIVGVRANLKILWILLRQSWLAKNDQ